MTEGGSPTRQDATPGPAETRSAHHADAHSGRLSNLRSHSQAALASVFYLLLADAAFETFRSGSSLRWLIMVVVAAYAIATVLLWRRLVWATKAVASFVLLLCLLAATTWIPGGITEGVVLIGQPTSTILSLLTILAVLLAGFSLIQLKSIPPAARWAIGFLVVYGAVAFVYGIAAHTPYLDLLHGDSLWFRLPSWLQGAFIGALVVAPAGLLSRIAATWHGVRGAKARGNGMQLIVLAAAVVMAVGTLRAPAGSARNQRQFDVGGFAPRLGHLVFARAESGGRPVGRADQFQQGVKAVFAFIDFEGLKAEDTVSAVWYQGADQLFEEKVKVAEAFGATSSPKGGLRFAIRFPNGAQPGGYFLEVSVNDRLALAGIFGVKPK